MNRLQVDRLIGQTPCLCASIETWHPECYAGKSDAEIEKARTRAYAIVRRWIAAQRVEITKRTLGLAGTHDISSRP